MMYVSCLRQLYLPMSLQGICLCLYGGWDYVRNISGAIRERLISLSGYISQHYAYAVVYKIAPENI